MNDHFARRGKGRREAKAISCAGEELLQKKIVNLSRSCEIMPFSSLFSIKKKFHTSKIITVKFTWYVVPT